MTRKHYIVSVMVLLVIAAGWLAMVGCMAETTTQPATVPATMSDDINEWWKIKQEYEEKWQKAATVQEKNRIQAELLQLFTKAEFDRSKRNKFTLAGEVVDENGKTLKDVTILVVKTLPEFWFGDAAPKTKQPPVEKITVDGNFDLSYSGYTNVELVFVKEGYYIVRLSLTEKGEVEDLSQLIRRGEVAPTSQPGRLRIVLEPVGKTTTLQKHMGGGMWLDWIAKVENLSIVTKPVNPRQSDFERQKIKVKSKDDVPKNCLVAFADRNAQTGDFVTRELLRNDGEHIKVPTNTRLYLNAPDGGFCLYKPKRPFLAMRDMKEAPKEQYKQELVITEDMVNQVTRFGVQDKEDNRIFFYIKTADGKFGKGYVESVNYDSRKGYAGVNVKVFLQPDGSRNLNDPEIK